MPRVSEPMNSERPPSSTVKTTAKMTPAAERDASDTANPCVGAVYSTATSSTPGNRARAAACKRRSAVSIGRSRRSINVR